MRREMSIGEVEHAAIRHFCDVFEREAPQAAREGPPYDSYDGVAPGFS